ncbi:MAG: 23S rRNA (guanosine(2251)-2'-O)-methyltransferase RlmB [Burkholderiaceae bacterium]|jgi:23S rRNA (guanosine2251-2'-O)-methyltransferase
MASSFSQQVLLGFHAVRARLRTEASSIQSVLIDRDRQDARLKALTVELQAAGCSVSLESGRQLDRLAKGQRHQGVLALADYREPSLRYDDLLDGQGFMVFLDGVTDPHNLGAVLRTAEASGARAVVAPKDHSAPLNEVAVRVSAGASETLPYMQVTNLVRAIEQAQDKGYWALAFADEAGHSFYDQNLADQPHLLIFGSEDKGIRRLVREQADALVSLPMMGSVSSLNVSVACGVACYETLRQRQVKRVNAG